MWSYLSTIDCCQFFYREWKLYNSCGCDRSEWKRVYILVSFLINNRAACDINLVVYPEIYTTTGGGEVTSTSSSTTGSTTGQNSTTTGTASTTTSSAGTTSSTTAGTLSTTTSGSTTTTGSATGGDSADKLETEKSGLSSGKDKFTRK